MSSQSFQFAPVHRRRAFRPLKRPLQRSPSGRPIRAVSALSSPRTATGASTGAAMRPTALRTRRKRVAGSAFVHAEARREEARKPVAGSSVRPNHPKYNWRHSARSFAQFGIRSFELWTTSDVVASGVSFRDDVRISAASHLHKRISELFSCLHTGVRLIGKPSRWSSHVQSKNF